MHHFVFPCFPCLFIPGGALLNMEAAATSFLSPDCSAWPKHIWPKKLSWRAARLVLSLQMLLQKAWHIIVPPGQPEKEVESDSSAIRTFPGNQHDAACLDKL